MAEQFRDKIPYFHKTYGSEATEWKLRILQRRNVYDRLKQEGRLALLGLTSILVGIDLNGDIPRLEEFSNAKEVFRNSVMYKINAFSTNKRVSEISTSEFQRAEQGYQAFMKVVILSTQDLENNEVLKDFFELKKWVYRHMHNSGTVDQILAYLKWLGKLCQALFLRTEIPEKESYFPSIFGDDHPFRNGEFAFINELYKSGKRTRALSVNERYCLAQLSNGMRPLPYPSHKQVQDQVQNTLGLITEKKALPEKVKAYHKAGVRQIVERLHEPENFMTHISLTASACNELPREEGGKGAWLVSQTRKFCNELLIPRDLDELVGAKDCFGFEILNHATYAQFIKLMSDPEQLLEPRLGDLIYLEPENFVKHMDSLEVTNIERLPYSLTKVLLLGSVKELLKMGSFNLPISPNRFNLPIFRGDISKLEFIPSVKSIPVSASLSIESGMKSRLVTAAPAAYTEIGQLINNFMRQYLSKDEFLRVGFEEPDKLWEVLKAYDREYFSTPQ